MCNLYTIDRISVSFELSKGLTEHIQMRQQFHWMQRKELTRCTARIIIFHTCMILHFLTTARRDNAAECGISVLLICMHVRSFKSFNKITFL